MESGRGMEKERLDVLLVERGFFETREKAKRHIMAGVILVHDRPVDKAGTRVDRDAPIRIRGKVMPYVGRGGYKLEKALSLFPISLKGAVMADIGASTGGFTDCALQHGASRVYAIDVGTNQLDWKMRRLSQVISLEKTNIKDVTLETLGEPVDFVSADVSFISVLKILPAVDAVLKPEGTMVILVKPQFEAGREQVGRGGIIHDPAVHRSVLVHTMAALREDGWSVLGLTYSPIKGTSGNVEFLLWAGRKKAGPDGTGEDPDRMAARVVAEAHENLKR